MLLPVGRYYYAMRPSAKLLCCPFSKKLYCCYKNQKAVQRKNSLLKIGL